MSNEKLAATFHGFPATVFDDPAPAKPDLTPEQDLRAAVAERIADATHFNGCPGGPETCRCLIGRLNWAINAEEVR